MADMLNTALIDSQRFVVLERADLKDVLDELGPPPGELPPIGGTVATTGTTGSVGGVGAGKIGPGATTGSSVPSALIDPASAPKTGRLLGAQVLIRGALTELSYKKSETSAGGGVISSIANLENVSFTAICGIDLKVIEVETGRILDSVHAEGKAESKAKALSLDFGGVHFGQQKFDTSPLAKAIRAAIDEGVKQICRRLDEIPWEGRVATVTDHDGKKTLYLNFGADVGIKPGAELELFRPGAVVVDPETHLVIGREDDVVLGTCTIRNSTKTMTVANLVTDAQVTAGDGVRLVRKPDK
jgi:curli biogenesis system outer membrane secretion channel CsgG